MGELGEVECEGSATPALAAKRAQCAGGTESAGGRGGLPRACASSSCEVPVWARGRAAPAGPVLARGVSGRRRCCLLSVVEIAEEWRSVGCVSVLQLSGPEMVYVLVYEEERIVKSTLCNK